MGKQTLVMRYIDSYGVGSKLVTQVDLVCEDTGDQVAKVEIAHGERFVVTPIMYDPYYTPQALTEAVLERLDGYMDVAMAFDDLGEPEVYVEVRD